MKKNPLEGKIATVQFDSGLQFRLDFLPDNQMRWTSTGKEDAGATAVETIYVVSYPGDILSIDWVEESGLCVSYTLDVANQYVKSFMTFTDENYRGGRRPFLHEGPFQFILENGEPDKTSLAG
ncbi:MoaF-related domain-containing protein [Enterococcus sp. CSURQ0835]|uniref:MoaF-related domain-containing protein n=1 Tax=Enterococcus sp. CSURQ0835 TaxID=2681394 RepID=UPI001357D09A|nr:MoaF N-terminal domain-containing protein [Enterococcus sp. CSURQ0835]